MGHHNIFAGQQVQFAGGDVHYVGQRTGQIQQPQTRAVGHRPLALCAHADLGFRRGFRQVDVQGQVQLRGQIAAGGQDFRRGGVDAVRVYGYTQPVVVLAGCGQGASGLQCGLGARAGCGGKSKHGFAARAAQPGLCSGPQYAFFKKVHVHAGRGAGAQHFRIAHKAAQVDHFGRKGLLHGKDALVEPVHEGHIVGQAAQQGHGRVGVGVDQARKRIARPRSRISPGLPVRGQICARAHGGHLSVVHGQRGVFQHPALTVLGDDNRRVEQHVALLHEFSLK